jgi:deazaflavin-dependent oxidoreductase (nitroreductase family)
LADATDARPYRKGASPADGRDPNTFRRFMRAFSRLNVFAYRWSGGRLMKTAMGGYPVCVIGFTGRKTGRRREIPLIHVPDGERKILVGSMAGLDTHPAWVHSVRANPEISITADGCTQRYRAREVEGVDRETAWRRMIEIYPPYEDYQLRTERTIPVFVCDPLGFRLRPLG